MYLNCLHDWEPRSHRGDPPRVQDFPSFDANELESQRSLPSFGRGKFGGSARTTADATSLEGRDASPSDKARCIFGFLFLLCSLIFRICTLTHSRMHRNRLEYVRRSYTYVSYRRSSHRNGVLEHRTLGHPVYMCVYFPLVPLFLSAARAPWTQPHFGPVSFFLTRLTAIPRSFPVTVDDRRFRAEEV